MLAQGRREEMPLHMQKDIHKHMQLLLTRQKETDEKVLSLETYQKIKVKEPWSFLWAIDNWPEIEMSKDDSRHLFLSRKFKFAGELTMRLQMVKNVIIVVQNTKEGVPIRYTHTSIVVHALVSDSCSKQLPFTILLNC